MKLTKSKIIIGAVIAIVFIAVLTMNIILAFDIPINVHGGTYVISEVLTKRFDPMKVDTSSGRPIPVPPQPWWWLWGVLPIDLLVLAIIGLYVYFGFIRPKQRAKKAAKPAGLDEEQK